jgi:hypothetical protein
MAQHRGKGVVPKDQLKGRLPVSCRQEPQIPGDILAKRASGNAGRLLLGILADPRF